MAYLIGSLQLALFLFMLVLIGRMVFSFVMAFSRDWRPSGVVLVLVEGIFTITDPPLKALRRIIPPIQLGAVRLDIAFLLLFFACSILFNLLSYFAPA